MEKLIAAFQSERPGTGLMVRCDSADRFIKTWRRPVEDVANDLRAFAASYRGLRIGLSPLIHTEDRVRKAAPVVAATLPLARPEDEAQIRERLARFSLTPTWLVRSVGELAAIWKLAEAFPVAGVEGELTMTTVIVKLQRRLGVTHRPVSLTRYLVPLPGSTVSVSSERIETRDVIGRVTLGGTTLVEVTMETLGDAVSLEELEAVVAGDAVAQERSLAETYAAALRGL